MPTTITAARPARGPNVPAGQCRTLRTLAGRRRLARYPLELLDTPPRGWTGDLRAHGGAVACSPVLTATALGWRGAEFAGAEWYLRREGVHRQGLWPVLAPAVISNGKRR
ncbi:hypothetical protein [Nocardia sp. NPDC004860]|uniref:hypothetical protein n=1 Tax=Nocardia sp. NPDC004860 TaxID=3154557 RepID=UPI0033AFD4CE